MRTAFVVSSVIFIILQATCMQAQVTFGLDEAPVEGALLQLKTDQGNGVNSKRGLIMPRVELSDPKKMKIGVNEIPESEYDKHIGLTVYNVIRQETANRLCPGLHVWNGSMWQPLLPYPRTSIKRGDIISTERGAFVYLDPNNASDPGWELVGKNPSAYPVSYMGLFTDKRPYDVDQSYPYARFYVGYFPVKKTYKAERVYPCTASAPDEELIVDGYLLEDGIWMTENLRAEKMSDGTNIINSAANNATEPYFAYPTAITSNGTDPTTYNANPKLGLFYNWAAVTNRAKEGLDKDESGLSEGIPIQGICPTGWHVPSDREWTDLENAIIRSTSTFSTTPTIGEANLISYSSIYSRGTHSDAMKSTQALTARPAGGTSYGSIPVYPDNKFGFNVLIVGIGSNGLVESSYYGNRTWFWTSSAAFGGTNAWYRRFNYDWSYVYKNTNSRGILSQVRCKKD